MSVWARASGASSRCAEWTIELRLARAAAGAQEALAAAYTWLLAADPGVDFIEHVGRDHALPRERAANREQHP